MNKTIKKYVPGIVFVLAISIASMFLNDLLKVYINLEALTIAIIIGIIYNNTVGTQKVFNEGVKFSLKKLLKVGIVLLGFKLNINSLLQLGPKILIMVMIYVPVALILSMMLGKVLKVNKKLSALIGVGSCICGASAVVAMAPCIGADDDDSVISVSIVSFLGAIGVLIYSGVAASQMDLSPVQYGAWSGLSLHGVAHALAAAFAGGNEAGEIGTIVKMTRVLMLVPVSIVLSLIFNKGNTSSKKTKFPMYVLYFILAGVINSLGIIPTGITNILTNGSSIFILMAMTAMGLSVNLKSILNKGIKALITGTILFIILSTGSLLVIMNIL
ncbi:YeiH family protein [Vallitalea guaymasensis]|uniref:YeiH family protein n=1 Tax=Vallitalea guaymasensis TaxID=1185412 RepID=UPI00272DC18E|nr:putative sulfate exporter family transporter [Vallitalea guaymasensis]